MTGNAVSGSVSERRNIALVGTYGSGKTTLLESILFVTGATTRKGSVADGNSVGDVTPEARQRHMTVELNVASTRYGDLEFTFLDCPGSVELQQETNHALMGVDGAILVCEADPDRCSPYLPCCSFSIAGKFPTWSGLIN